MKLMQSQPRFLVWLWLSASLGCTACPPDSEMQAADLVATFITSKLDNEAEVQKVVSNAAASNCAVMFVNVDWAPMEPQRTRFAEFAIAYRRKHPKDPVHFHYVDCSRSTYTPLSSLAGWQALQDTAGGSLIHGWGELVWMERGHVLHVEKIMNFASASALIEKTESLMPPQNRD